MQNPGFPDYFRQLNLQQPMFPNIPNSPPPQTCTNFDDEKIAKMSVVIFGLAEPLPGDPYPNFTDSTRVQKILSEIGVPSNAQLIERMPGKSKPKRVFVQFHLKRDRDFAIRNMTKLKDIPEWRNIRIYGYETLAERQKKENDINKKKMSDKKDKKKQSHDNPFINFVSRDDCCNNKEINILVIGETGVGKSTWINGIANYMSFNTFDDAMAINEPICLIPMKVEDKMMKPTKGREDENEGKYIPGESCTQEPKVYRYVTDLYTFNLIDTPGIGDTRGIEADIENMKMVFECLSNSDAIHGICLLLEPTEHRFKPPIRYCLEELLANLHKDSIPNITVVFTNARSTLYGFGEMLTILKTFVKEVEERNNNIISLKEENVFCVDNEAVNVLYGQYNGTTYNLEVIEDSSHSWNHTVKETHRLFKYFTTLLPHSTAATKATNQIRQVLWELLTILADLNEQIAQNKKIIEEQTTQLKSLENNLAERQNVNYQGIEVKETRLSYPTTVCCGANCSEKIKSPNSNVLQTFYKKTCCSSCHLRNVNETQMGHVNLRQCTIFDQNANCKSCGCLWQSHMHFWYSQQKVSTQFSHPANQDEINRLKLQISKKPDYILQLQTTISNFEKSYKTIQNLCRPYYEFLSENSIIAFNNGFEEYLKREIEVVEKLTADEKRKNRLEKLENLRQILQEQKFLIASFKDIEISNTTDQKIDLLNYMKKIKDLEKIVPQLLNSQNYQRLFKIHHYKLVRCSAKNKLSGTKMPRQRDSTSKQYRHKRMQK